MRCLRNNSFSRIQFLLGCNKGNLVCNSIPQHQVVLNRQIKMAISPIRKEYKFQHYRQQYEWDCGISCILMLLPHMQREYFVENFDEICKTEGFGQSTWTIDLCYLLKAFSIRHVYFTTTIGVDPAYAEFNYYKNIITKDKERVNKRFHYAESNGITVDKRTVGFDAFIKHLSTNGPIILLTNSALLTCDICQKEKIIDDEEVGYTGHYILLVGYDLMQNKILYRNPGKEDHVCITLMHYIDKARTAFGTDEDVIFIFN